MNKRQTYGILALCLAVVGASLTLWQPFASIGIALASGVFGYLASKE